MESSGPSSEESIGEEIGARDATPKNKLPSRDGLRNRRFATVTKLKEYYGIWILRVMAAQLFFVNAIFVTYAWAGYNWQPPEVVTTFWISSTFVQIVGVVVAITRSIFPNEDEND